MYPNPPNPRLKLTAKAPSANHDKRFFDIRIKWVLDASGPQLSRNRWAQEDLIDSTTRRKLPCEINFRGEYS